jgi:hypothetical protein
MTTQSDDDLADRAIRAGSLYQSVGGDWLWWYQPGAAFTLSDADGKPVMPSEGLSEYIRDQIVSGLAKASEHGVDVGNWGRDAIQRAREANARRREQE